MDLHWYSKDNVGSTQVLGERGFMVELLVPVSYGAESRKKVVSSNLGFASQQWENCQASSKWAPVSNQERIGPVKEGWASPSICCAQESPLSPICKDLCHQILGSNERNLYFQNLLQWSQLTFI